MTRLLTAVLLFASFQVVADDLKTFSDGQVIEADDFNHNFQKLEQDIVDIPAGPRGDKGDKGDTGEQGLPGLDGADGQDAVSPFENLNCDEGDTLTFGNSGWECAPYEAVVTAFITFNDWQDEGPDGQWTDVGHRSLSELDTTVSSNVMGGSCVKSYIITGQPHTGTQTSCGFSVGVSDHACAVRVSDGHESKSNLYRGNGSLGLEQFHKLAEGHSYTIDILCYADPLAP